MEPTARRGERFDVIGRQVMRADEGANTLLPLLL